MVDSTDSATNSRPIVIVNDDGIAWHHGSRLVTARLVDELSAFGHPIVTIPSSEKWRDHRGVIDRSVLVVVNGEGTLHHGAPRAKELVAVGPYCAERSIPAVLVNTVWQDNSIEMAGQVRAFRRVFVRESWSHRELANQGVSSDVVPDLTLGWTPVDADVPQRRTGLVVTDSVSLPASDALFKVSRSRQDAVFATLRPARNAERDYSRSSFSRVPPTRPSLTGLPAVVTDTVVTWAFGFRGALKRWKRQVAGQSAELCLEDYLNLLRSSELLVTGRYHAVCLALLEGTPFLALRSNSHKMEGMLDDAGLSHRVMTLEELPDHLADPPPWTDADEQSRLRYLAVARQSQRQMFADLAVLVSSTSR